MVYEFCYELILLSKVCRAMPRSFAALVLFPPVCARVARINSSSISHRVRPDVVAEVAGVLIPSGSRCAGNSWGGDLFAKTEDYDPFNGIRTDIHAGRFFIVWIWSLCDIVYIYCLTYTLPQLKIKEEIMNRINIIFSKIVIIPFAFMFCVLIAFLDCANASRTMEIIDIDLQIFPNPIPCGSTAEATADIETYPIGQLSRDVLTKATLWDHDSWFRDGDDPLDHSSVTLSETEGHVFVTFTLHCQIKSAGCDLYGPAGNSGESGTEVFVSILGSDVESPHVYVQCQQTGIDAELDLYGTDSVTAGEDAEVTLSTKQAIHNLDHATWKIEFDNSNLVPNQVTYLNTSVESATTHTLNSDHILFEMDDSQSPLTLDGSIISVTFSSLSSPATIWDTTDITISDDSIFVDNSETVLEVCDGGAHSIFIAPNDTTPPVLHSEKIYFGRSRITGSVGSAGDDIGPLENYLSILLYDENEELVARDFTQLDGSFVLDKFFELSLSKPSRIVLANGIDLSVSHQFTPGAPFLPGVLSLLLNNSSPQTLISEVSPNPSPIGPPVELHATVTDPDKDLVSISVDWGDGNSTDYGSMQTSGSVFIVPHIYLLPGTYFIKARGKDSKNHEGAWSPEYMVEMVEIREQNP